MVFMYRGLFTRLKEVKLVGAVLGWPTVLLHEIVGHMIPALLSGSNIIGLDLREEKGQVAVKYEKSIFGGVSVLIAGLGPTFVLPLLFVVAYCAASGQGIISFITEPSLSAKYAGMLSDISSLDNVWDFLLVIAAIVIAPGAASSAGDMRSIVGFMRESPLIALVMGMVAFFVLYASYDGGLPLSDYGSMIAANAVCAFLVMYIIALLSLYIIVEGSNLYAFSMPTLVCGIIASKYLIVPAVKGTVPLAGVLSGYPLLAGLGAACLVVFLVRLKK
ncbi:MAG: hypothetical protein N3G76_02740 [Candidatus Micrarchaeota archaeon]|nr:hypothetical protein [Candidatus Micrarchaeota archaeon]